MPSRPEPLTYAMVGGGRGAFIGAVHRMAVALDGGARLVAGALSSTPEKARESARDLGLPDERSHGSWQELLESERRRPDGERIDFVAIVTPNDSHFAIAEAFLHAGVNVVLDKPMVHTSTQAQQLVRSAGARGLVLAVTYNYTGYPLVKHARELVRSGELGTIRKVFVEYHQGWLATALEAEGQKQASWRTDPSRSGIAGAVGDIGTHAENLVSTVTGLEIEELCADLATFVPGRRLDDDASVLLRFASGARGVLTCSQVCVGEENNLAIRVYGTRGSVAWSQEHPNHLAFTAADGPRRIVTRAGAGVSPAAAPFTRLPAGHPEAFIEAFANVYKGVFEAIRARREGRAADPVLADYPTGADGLRGVRFIEAVVESSAAGGRWIRVS